ncbi:MAG: potassium transporter TrkG [Parvularculaceae bacterium]
MGYPSILRGFGVSLIVLGAAMLAPFIAAIAAGEAGAGAFAFGASAAFFAGFGAVSASSGKHPPTDFRGALLLVLLWWIVAPVFAALPFLLHGMTFSDAYFEAVSAMTTTGGWLSDAAARASISGVLWRAELEWLGGLASVSIAAAIFVRPTFVGIDTLLPPFSLGEEDSYLSPLRDAIRSFSVVYALVTLFCFTIAALLGAPLLDAAVMSMSIVASGGFIPHQEGLAGYGLGIESGLFPFIVLSGANFVLVARLLRGVTGRARDAETGAFLLIILAVGAMFWTTAGAGDISLLPAQLFNAASLLSTNGFLIGEAPTVTAAIVTAVIGGAAVSTAGGFKILRWLVIMRRAHEEIRLLVTPRAVFGLSRIANELGVWMHFLMFTMTLAGLLLLIALNGHSFEAAALAATAVLSNTGPLLALAGEAHGGYAIFETPLRWVLAAGMILGRLEAVAGLALINRAFWRS